MATTVRERIYQTIKDEIYYGKLSPGERLVESKLVAQFKSSRSPIREALRQMESEGLVTFEHNKGFTVSKLSIQEVSEIYDLLWLLESYAARLSSQRVTKEDIKYLCDVQKKLYVAVKNYDLEAWIQNNYLFHEFFPQHSGNRTLERTIEANYSRIHQFRYTIATIPTHFKDYLEQHERILKWVKLNNGKMVEKYMRVHIQNVKEALVAGLSEKKQHQRLI